MEPPSISCVDAWPPRCLTGAVMAAYRHQARAGMLRIQRIETHPNTGRTLVGYLSAIPHPWMLDQLGRRKREIEGAGEQMRMEE